MKTRIFSGLLVFVLLLGCFTSSVAFAKGSELIYGSRSTLSGLDIHGKDSLEAGLIVRNVFDSLVKYDYDTGTYLPELATKWEVIDPLTWKFTLREGVTFHDGTPLTSEAVKVSVKLIQDRNGPIKPMLEDVETVETPDEYTAIFKLKQPAGYLLSGLSITAIAPPWALSDIDKFIKHPIGTGPFKFSEWIPNRHQILVANESYWEPDAVKLSTIKMVEIPEGAGRATALINGEIDIADYVEYADVDVVKESKGVDVVVRPPMRGFRIFINTGINPERGDTPNPFADPRVREALWYSINVEVLAEMYDFARPAGTVMARGVIGAADLPLYEHNIEKAKELLAEAGYPNGFSCTLKVRHLDSLVAEIAEMIAWDLADAGIDAEIILQPNPVWVADVSPTDNNPFDLSLFNHGATLPDPFYILDRMFTWGAKRTGYKNDEFDALLREANAQTDPDERIRMYKEAQRMIWGTGPTMFPIEVVDYRGIADHVHDYNHNDVRADFRGVWVDK